MKRKDYLCERTKRNRLLRILRRKRESERTSSVAKLTGRSLSSYLSLESGEAPDPEDLTRPRARDGGLVVEVVVHPAVAVVDEGGEGRHGRRRGLFPDAVRVGERGKKRYLLRPGKTDPLME